VAAATRSSHGSDGGSGWRRLLPLRGRLLCTGGDAFPGAAPAAAGDVAAKRTAAAGAAVAAVVSDAACAASCAAAAVSARPHIALALGLHCSAATSSEGLGNDTAWLTPPPACAAPAGSAQPCAQPTGERSDTVAEDACGETPPRGVAAAGLGVARSNSGVRAVRPLAGVAAMAGTWRGVALGGCAGRRGVAP
jgi:hypothetical protein